MAVEKFVKAGGFATRIKHYGFDKPEQADKPVLLLLHGYLESLDVWEDFITLIQEYKVVTMDIPGHGISEVKGDIHTMEMMAGLVSDVADSIDIDKFYIAGHSMGGYVASQCLESFPERLKGIIMFHSTPNPDSPQKKVQREREIKLIESGKKDLLAGSVENGFAEVNRKKFADVIEDMKELVILTEEQGIINLLRGMMVRKDHNETFRNSSVPQLFVMGELDGHIPVDISRKLEKDHPQARFEYLNSSGHMGFIEEPERSAEIILSFGR